MFHPFFNSLSNRLRITHYCLRSVSSKYLAKFQSPRAITWPKIIRPERNVNLICNLSLYTHIPNIKSISQSIAKKVVTTVLFRNYGMTDMGNTVCPGYLVAGT